VRILVAVDVHDQGEKVVAHAVPWARRFGGNLDLAYVSEWSVDGLPRPPFPTDELDELWQSWTERADEERAMLDDVEVDVPEDLRGALLFHGGRPIDVLPDLARGYDLLVIASHSRRGLERVVLGSVTARVVRRAVCPVLVVGLDDPAIPETGALRVLAPVDDEDACALPWIHERLPGALVEIVHVTAPELPALLRGIDPPAERLARQRQIAKHLEGLALENGLSAIPVHLVPRDTSNPGDAIAKVAHAQNADVIVMPTHGRTGLDHLLLGSVAERVVDRAHCAVLVVPKPLIAAGSRYDELG
jgi:nucleotide-binding universal stress UspA family protein